jgi:hypothetical protein
VSLETQRVIKRKSNKMLEFDLGLIVHRHWLSAAPEFPAHNTRKDLAFMKKLLNGT